MKDYYSYFNVACESMLEAVKPLVGIDFGYAYDIYVDYDKKSDEFCTQLCEELRAARIRELIHDVDAIVRREFDMFLSEQEDKEYIANILHRKASSFSERDKLIFEMGKMAGQLEMISGWYKTASREDGFVKAFNEIQGRRKYAKEIISYIYDNPGVQSKELAKYVDIKPNYLNEISGILEKELIIERRRGGRNTYYYLTLMAAQQLEKQRENLKCREKKEKEECIRVDLESYSKRSIDEALQRIYQRKAELLANKDSQFTSGFKIQSDEKNQKLNMNDGDRVPLRRKRLPFHNPVNLEYAVLDDFKKSSGNKEKVFEIDLASYLKGGDNLCLVGQEKSQKEIVVTTK